MQHFFWLSSFSLVPGFFPSPVIMGMRLEKYGSTIHSHFSLVSIMVGLFGSLILDPLYPLMKRWTQWPQAFLGRPANQELSVLAL